MPLTEQQQLIVNQTDGHLVVLAGPGCGKTHTIIEKIAFLFDQEIIPEPFGVLAVTFTNAAAQEMRTRLRAGGFRQWDRVWIGTFHGFSAYMLRNYGGDIGIREDFEIIDRDQQNELLSNIAESLHLKANALEFAKLISDLKRQGIYPPNDRIPDKLHRIYQEYQEALRNSNNLDFNDLVPFTIRLFQESLMVRRVFTKFFRYIIVDEFQDTDRQQYLLIGGLAKAARGSTIVADDDQSIYGWRGANRANIYAIEKKLNAERIVLDANFRSDEIILQAALAVIGEESNRVPKPLKAVSKGNGHIYRQDFLNPHEEALQIARWITDLNPDRETRIWSDLCLIARSGWRIDETRSALTEFDVPWFDRDALSFEISWETTLSLAILSMATDISTSDSLYQVMKAVEEGGLAYYLGNRDALDIALEFRDNLQDSLSDVPNIQDVRAILEMAKFAEIIAAVSESNTELNRITQNIESMVNDIETISVPHDLSLQETIRRLQGNDAVQLMTGHKSKGLEFDIVFMLGLEDDVLPDYRSHDDLDEERRIFYVGLTRARRGVYLTWANERLMPWGKIQAKKRSRFIDAIPDSLFSIPPL